MLKNQPRNVQLIVKYFLTEDYRVVKETRDVIRMEHRKQLVSTVFTISKYRDKYFIIARDRRCFRMSFQGFRKHDRYKKVLRNFFLRICDDDEKSYRLFYGDLFGW